MEDLKPIWITSVTTDDIQTGTKCRIAFHMERFDTIIKFERLEEKDGRKSYSTMEELKIGNIANSGFDTFFGVCSAKINAPRTDEQETRYHEVLKTHFEQGALKVIRFSYNIAPGAKNDYKRARSAMLKVYSFANYQEAKPYLTRQPNGSHDQLPENNCTFALYLKLMPKYNTTGMGGKSWTEAEAFLSAAQNILGCIDNGILLTRVFHHVTQADENYQAAKTSQAYVAQQVNTNTSLAPADNEEDFPF